jgi:4a-hydroxytetrahydrobiopterin dehydratase
VTVRPDAVDLKLVSDDAIYTDDDGAAHVVQWVTRVDVDLARRISEIAAEHGLTPDPSSVGHIELGLDASVSAAVAPVWVALLTGNAEDQGRGTPEGDEIRDGLGRVPNLWFGDPSDGESGGQRFHLEVYVAPEVVEGRVAAAVAAGGTVVDDSSSPMLTVIADQDGNTGVLCTDVSAAPGA